MCRHCCTEACPPSALHMQVGELTDRSWAVFCSSCYSIACEPGQQPRHGLPSLRHRRARALREHSAPMRLPTDELLDDLSWLAARFGHKVAVPDFSCTHQVGIRTLSAQTYAIGVFAPCRNGGAWCSAVVAVPCSHPVPAPYPTRLCPAPKVGLCLVCVCIGPQGLCCVCPNSSTPPPSSLGCNKQNLLVCCYLHRPDLYV